MEEWIMEGALIGMMIGALWGFKGDSLIDLVDSLTGRSRTQVPTDEVSSSAEESGATEESEGISEKELQEEKKAEEEKTDLLRHQPFTHPHEWDRFTRPAYEDEKDPRDRRLDRDLAIHMAKKYQKWLRSLSQEDRDAEANRTSNGLTVTDEYIQIMQIDRPDFMRRYDEACKAEAKAHRAGWPGDDWVVGRVNDGDLKAMSPAERAQYEQWIKRLDSFHRRHGEARIEKEPPAKLQERMSGFTSTAGSRDASESTPRPPWVR